MEPDEYLKSARQMISDYFPELVTFEMFDGQTFLDCMQTMCKDPKVVLIAANHGKYAVIFDALKKPTSEFIVVNKHLAYDFSRRVDPFNSFLAFLKNCRSGCCCVCLEPPSCKKICRKCKALLCGGCFLNRLERQQVDRQFEQHIERQSIKGQRSSIVVVTGTFHCPGCDGKYSLELDAFVY